MSNAEMISYGQYSATDIASAIAAMAVAIAAFVMVVVLAGIDYRGFLPHWKRGLMLGTLLAIAMVPAKLIESVYFDPAVASGTQDPMGIKITWWVYVATSIASFGVFAAWTMVLYYITRYEWGLLRERYEASGFAIASGARLAVAAGIGAALGLVSIVVFNLLGVGLGPGLSAMLRNFPGIGDAPPAILLTIGLSAASIAAVSEELQYRGAILGFFIRVTGNRSADFWIVNAMIAIAFATMHLVNVDMPMVKFVQILILALATGALARWAGVLAAIACHLSMNVVAALGELAMSLT